ncbi:MAG: hypothetical protein EAZ40_09820 [Rhodobacterales bacterium]|nr:MAG: hypothetical protein EAZ40_09820 [Rhodobacterales bacterium]
MVTMERAMNIPFLAAAALSAATFGLHVVGGGAEFHAPIQAVDMPLPLRTMSAILWHYVSAMLLLQAAAFGWVARTPNMPLLWFLIAVQLCFAGLFLVYGLMMLGSIWVLLQWVIFIAIAGLALWGQWSGARPLPAPDRLVTGQEPRPR